ncbi:MAG: thioredoxin [Candidatus Gracilibacteria bacterium]|nr:thioredoxin [Candidatus Gracilibacteria bacterium]
MAQIVTDADFNSEVLESQGVVLVDFYADWCGPCQMLSPVIDELATEMEGKAKVVKVNVDNAGETARKYGIMSIPTILLFKDGELVETLMGVQGKNVLVSKIEEQL